MVLHLDGVPLSMLQNSGLLEFLQHHGAVKQQSAAFVSQGPLPVHGQVVHIVQGEVAVVRLHEAPALAALGSSDATTCLIALLHDEATSTAAAAHFDEAAATPAIVRALEGMQAPSLYLVGAFKDVGSTGAGVLHAVLQQFQRAATPVHLRLFCAGALNTGTNGAPLCQSVALDLHARPPVPFPAVFADRGPAVAARRAQLWLPGGPGAASIYSSASCRLDFRHRAGAVSQELRDFLTSVTGCSDWELLVRLSTSPGHELPHVAKDLRASIAWLLRQRGPMVQRHRQYTWTEGEGWQLAGQNGSCR